AFTVAERTNEIGIRIALGAGALQVLGMIVQQGYRLVLLGGLLGLAVSFAASRFLKTLLFAIGPYDPLNFATVTVAIGLVTLVAVMIPARRATQVDPMVALRSE